MNYDVFICHASEDKEEFVSALAASLSNSGLLVWYDDLSLRLGDSLSDSISKGLAKSTYGVVVLSPHFINKKWTKRELGALIAREDESEKVILPIWHNITKEMVVEHLPLLADKLAVSSSVGVEKCVLKILSVAKIEKIADRKCQEAEQFLLSGKKSDALNCYIEALYIDKNHAKAHAGMKNLYSGEYFVNSKENSYAGWRLGSVEWFNYKKGFGFVSDEDGTSHFIHISSVERYGESIADGDFIVFQIQSSHGKTAVATFVNLSNR